MYSKRGEGEGDALNEHGETLKRSEKVLMGAAWSSSGALQPKAPQLAMLLMRDEPQGRGLATTAPLMGDGLGPAPDPEKDVCVQNTVNT